MSDLVTPPPIVKLPSATLTSAYSALALDIAGVGVMVIDATGRLVEVNTAFCELMQQHSEALINLNLGAIVRSAAHVNSASLLERLFNADPQQESWRFIRPEQSALVVDVSWRIAYQHAKPFAIVVLHDRSGERSLEQSLQQLTSTFDERLKVRTQRAGAYRDALSTLTQLDKSEFKSAIARVLKLGRRTLKVARGAYYHAERETSDEVVLTLIAHEQSRDVALPRIAPQLLEAEHPGYFALLRTVGEIAADDAFTHHATATLASHVYGEARAYATLDSVVWLSGRMYGVLRFEVVSDSAFAGWQDDETDFVKALGQVVSSAAHESVRAQLFAELSRSKENYKQVVDHAWEAILVVQDDRVQFANWRYTELSGFTAENIPNGRLIDTCHPNDRSLVDTARARADSGEETRVVVRHRKLDGDYFWAEVNIVRIHWENRPARLVFLQDVSEKKRAESETLTALARERELSELKTRLVSMASHEIATPLATILSSAEILEHYGASMSDQERLTSVKDIQIATQRLKALLDDVKSIDRDNMRYLTYQPAPTDLPSLIERLVREAELAKREPGVVNCTLTLPAEPIETDASLIAHVLSNVLSNAIKYSREPKRISLTASIAEQQLCFTVQDNGIGIPKNEQHLLAEAFFRASNVGETAGTGLGLAVVKRALKLLNGFIDVQSDVGVGTRVVITIPIASVTPSVKPAIN